MSDIIHILPDSVANQIAAGEVIQRPASVVKELVENSIDSGASEIEINIKDAGKTLIQVIDNGRGMSETDARLAFERHATSKINKADDLFCISTLGFRGEALASIAAIATVELKTKKHDNDLGTQITISGSEFVSQVPAGCSEGSNFSVKNLFYNVPARRKFLKSDTSEFHHIVDEFQRFSLAHPEISFSLVHNDSEIYSLPSGNLRQRIFNIFGKNVNQQIIPVNINTSIADIFGFIGKPESAKKNSGFQFFFVNNRFMRHPYFNKAIINAYENIIKPNEFIPYFIYFSVSPETLDVNIHPTKTEIKFEDENSIWQILRSCVKETLGKFNIAPSIDFDIDRSIEIPVTTSKTEIKQPGIKIDPEFNPFYTDNSKNSFDDKQASKRQQANLNNWDQLYEGFERQAKNRIPEDSQVVSKTIFESGTDENAIYDYNKFFQFKAKYIITVVKSGLMIIDQKRAHERILYEKFLNSNESNTNASQAILYPISIELNPPDSLIFKEIMPGLGRSGFSITAKSEFIFEINGIPDDVKEQNVQNIIDDIINNYQLHDNNPKPNIIDKIALSLSKSSSINYGTTLSNDAIRNLIDRLFACKSPSISPSGKKIITVLNTSEMEKIFES